MQRVVGLCMINTPISPVQRSLHFLSATACKCHGQGRRSALLGSEDEAPHFTLFGTRSKQDVQMATMSNGSRS